MSTIKADNFEGSLPGNPIILKTNSTERMRIDTTGNVGIGTAPTSYKLTVGGSSPQFSIIDSGANLSRALITVTPSGVSFGNTYSSTAIPLAFNIGVTEVARFSTSGNFGIGTASPAVALDVTGEARSSTSTTSSSNAKTLTTKDYVDGQAIGVGQTWQDVKLSRAVNTVYTNTTGRPIMVSVTCGSSQRLDPILVGGVDIGNIVSISTTTSCFSFIVPNNTTYQCGGAGDSFNQWCELR